MDDELPADEERLLSRVVHSLAERALERPRAGGAGSAAYDQALVSLRDEIAEARLEDVPALVAQMERLQGVSLQRAEAQAVLVDPAAPYFGHLRLREQVSGKQARLAATGQSFEQVAEERLAADCPFRR